MIWRNSKDTWISNEKKPFDMVFLMESVVVKRL